VIYRRYPPAYLCKPVHVASSRYGFGTPTLFIHLSSSSGPNPNFINPKPCSSFQTPFLLSHTAPKFFTDLASQQSPHHSLYSRILPLLIFFTNLSRGFPSGLDICTSCVAIADLCCCDPRCRARAGPACGRFANCSSPLPLPRIPTLLQVLAP
jgi:hypothetical protein